MWNPHLFRREVYDLVTLNVAHILVTTQKDTLKNDLDNLDSFRVPCEKRKSDKPNAAQLGMDVMKTDEDSRSEESVI